MASGKKLVRSKSGLKFETTAEIESPLMIIEPIWVPDKQSPICVSCSQKFDFLTRRHHCRRCGKCFCGSCCGEKASLPRMSFVDPVLHCKDCINITRKENDFFEKQVKLLMNGNQFEVQSTVFMDPSDSDSKHIYMCGLSNDHICLQFDCLNNNRETYDPVELLTVQSLQMLTTEDDSPGSGKVNGVSFLYRDSEGVMQTCQFLVLEQSQTQKKQALAWIAAFRMAVTFVFEKRKSKGSAGNLLLASIDG